MKKKYEPFKKQVVIEREYNGIKAMLRGGAKQKDVAVAFRRSSTTICSVARSETYEEFRNMVRDQWKKRKAKTEETEQQKTADEIEKKAESALRAIFQEVIDLLADLAAKEEEAVAVHVNMRDRIYVAETRLRQIFNGGIK